MSHFASVKDRKSCFYFLTRNQISLLLLGIPGDSDGKCGRPGFNPWVGKIPWRSVWPSTLVFLPGKFHGQRSLTSYRPWGHKELDTTEWITHTHTHTHPFVVIILMWLCDEHSDYPLEKEMAIHFSIFAWEIPGTERPGGV